MDNESQPKMNPEKQILDDNARKFTCDSLHLSNLSTSEVTSSILITDWLEVGEDNERKLVYKKFENGGVRIFLIKKVTKDGKRTTERQKISEEYYSERLVQSNLRVEKTRHEFNYEQNGVEFALKYDILGEDNPRLLEVDASTDQDRDLFDLEAFPVELAEVTVDMSYYGYRIAEHI